jgi:DNA polymerase-3 subunit gamma/tau
VPQEIALAPPESAPRAELDPMPQSFAEVIALFDKQREAVIRSHLWAHVHLVGFEPGRIEFRPEAAAPRDLANRLGQLLGEWTGARWVIAVSQAEGAPTLAAEEARRASEMRNEVAGHPLVRAVLDTFPGATIAAVRERFAAAAPAAEAGTDDAVEEEVAEQDGASAGEEGS